MNKTMKKFLIAALAVICFACLAFAVACGEKKYYTLSYICDEGVTIESDVKDGAEVKEGYEVSFTLVVAQNAFGEPAVTVNEVPLTADANGVYTFKMKADTVVEVTGVSLMSDYTVKFGVEVETEVDDGYGGTRVVTTLVQGIDWVRFSTLDGSILTDISVASGESISFKLDVSVYYDGYDYTVAAGSSVLTPDENGIYTYSVTGNQTIAVKGLPNDNQVASDIFIGRTVTDEDGNEVWEGTGAADSPFRIRTPLDLYYLAELIKNDDQMRNTLMSAYYVLENDIDMKDERLNVIGDNPEESLFFGGTFDGRGHTIKNYYINDTYHNYVTDTDEYLSCVGLFGFVQPYGGAGIYNLNLENFTVIANGAASKSAVYAGGLVGYGIGVTISNCSVNGTIIADGDNGYFGYVGGIIGFQQSAYLTDDTRFYSVIQSCSSNVEVNCDSGYIFAAGGIAGYQRSSDERTAAAILNCYFTGNISGAMRAGGITGYEGAYTSIKNCYATGSVIATSNITQTSGDTDYHLAYAGGIAGYAQYNSIISESFFTGTVDSRAAENNAYAHKDGIVGGVDADGTEFIYTDGTVVYKCYSTAKTEYGQRVQTVTDGFIKATIGWAEQDWKFIGNGAPVINKESADKSFTVTVMVGGEEKASLNITIDGTENSDAYIPVSYWYIAVGEDGNIKLPEFIGSGLRTYGYYFDAECKIKVPYSYIPTDNITLYAKFVNYNNVAGKYYSGYAENENNSYFELTADGRVLLRVGAVSYESIYVYNGDYLILQDALDAVISGLSDDFVTFKAEVTAGGLKIYDNDKFTESDPVTAVKKLDGFAYGTYYGENGEEYTFNENGTGVWNGTAVTYTIYGNTITVLRDGSAYRTAELTDGKIETLDGVSVTLYHPFKGEWEGTATSKISYSFDGKGGWTSGTRSGSYTYENGAITFDGKTAVYEDGLIKTGNETLYVKNSFVGTWVFASSSQPVYVTLNGISAEGYGTAVINYSSGGVYENLNYETYGLSGGTCLAIYNNYEPYAFLRYNAENNTLTATYLLVKGEISDAERSDVRLCLYDDYKGVWSNGLTGEDKFTVEFNGYGEYDLGANRDSLRQRGKITVTVGNNDSVEFNGVYLNEDGSLIGSFTATDGTTYTMTYADGKITVGCDSETYELELIK